MCSLHIPVFGVAMVMECAAVDFTIMANAGRYRSGRTCTACICVSLMCFSRGCTSIYTCLRRLNRILLPLPRRRLVVVAQHFVQVPKRGRPRKTNVNIISSIEDLYSCSITLNAKTMAANDR